MSSMIKFFSLFDDNRLHEKRGSPVHKKIHAVAFIA